MPKLYPLFSGSSGNSTYIELAQNQGVLVDVGRSAKQIENALRNNKIDISNIKAIFITHEHIDHIAGLNVFAKRHNIKVYSSAGTINALKYKNIITDKIDHQTITKSPLDLVFAEIQPFSISHDCCEGFGYTFKAVNGERIAICTDLGYISDEVKNSLKGSKMVVLESNHDVMMLQNGPYPYYLKRRILSSKGHLSNESCGEVLPFLVKTGTKNIILSHLSAHNNIPDLAYQNAIYNLETQGMVSGTDFNLCVAPKDNSVLKIK